MNKPTIIILPGDMRQSHFTSSPSQDTRHSNRLEFSWNKSSNIAELAEVAEDELSSEGQVETTGVDKEYRSEYCANYLQVEDTVMKRALSF